MGLFYNKLDLLKNDDSMGLLIYESLWELNESCKENESINSFRYKISKEIGKTARDSESVDSMGYMGNIICEDDEEEDENYDESMGLLAYERAVSLDSTQERAQ